jgi:membrane protein implicated in regulation of membrane protease activity
MQNQLLIITAICIAIGIVIGFFIVWLIYLQRQQQIVDSLIRPQNLIGCIGTVEVPFNINSQGKVRLNIKNSQVDFVAYTDEMRDFSQGSKVIVVS